MRAYTGRLTLALCAILATASACGGRTSSAIPSAPDSGVAPIMQQTASMTPDVLAPVVISQGAVNGADNLFTPRDGDTASGGQGQIVDGIKCSSTMPDNYHIHFYLGIVNEGRLIAIPDAIGMKNPGAASKGFINTASCFYNIHTHDASGMIHLESASNAPLSQVVYYLRNLLDIWGVPHSATRFGPFAGPIHVYVGKVPLGQVKVHSYNAYTGPYSALGLHSHEVIWIEIGKTYYTASQLPSVEFYTEY
jgi:hypothetical protein